MANKAISELPQAQNVNNQDLFVLEQSGIAKKLTAETFITEQGIIDALAEALDGHGGIQSVTLSSVSGRIRTYRITFTDQSATTFQVYDGTSIDRISRTSSSGLDDVYTIFLSDGTTTFFTVHNGADGTVSEAMLNDALKDKAPAVTETTESSAIANFTDGADDMVMHNVVAEINPVQDLAYGDPYPAGGGKNLISMTVGNIKSENVEGTWSGNTYTRYGVTFALSVDSGGNVIGITANGTATADIYFNCGRVDFTANVSYQLNGGADNGASSTYFLAINGGAEVYNSSQDKTQTFTADKLNNQIVIVVKRNTSVSNAVFRPMIRLSTRTDSTFAPYSNICPITGHTEVNVTRTGKNFVALNVSPVNAQFLREVTVSEQTAQKLTLVSSSATYAGLRLYYHLKAGTYTASVSATSSDSYEPTISIYRYGSNDLIVQNIKDGTPQSFTISEDLDVDIRLFATLGTAAVRTVTFSNFQIELGSTATAYEPYIAPTTVSLSWQTEAGTVYGGTIDVATGLLTVTHGFVTISDFGNPYSGTSYGGLHWADTSTSVGAIRLGNSWCSMLTRKDGNSGWASTSPCYAINDNGSVRIYITETTKAAMESAYADLEIVYPLATPQTYQLTPQQLMTLLGTNNVWADTGNVTVTYPADTKMYIEKLTIPSEDDLVANQAITSGKFFMVGNNLYLATAAIASGAKIIEGTNATRLSLADALNRL